MLRSKEQIPPNNRDQRWTALILGCSVILIIFAEKYKTSQSVMIIYRRLTWNCFSILVSVKTAIFLVLRTETPTGVFGQLDRHLKFLRFHLFSLHSCLKARMSFQWLFSESWSFFDAFSNFDDQIRICMWTYWSSMSAVLRWKLSLPQLKKNPQNCLKLIFFETGLISAGITRRFPIKAEQRLKNSIFFNQHCSGRKGNDFIGQFYI